MGPPQAERWRGSPAVEGGAETIFTRLLGEFDPKLRKGTKHARDGLVLNGPGIARARRELEPNGQRALADIIDALHFQRLQKLALQLRNFHYVRANLLD